MKPQFGQRITAPFLSAPAARISRSLGSIAISGASASTVGSAIARAAEGHRLPHPPSSQIGVWRFDNQKDLTFATKTI
jgi:hypothetical protein